MGKSKKSVILVVGMPGSGKTVATKAAATLGFRVFSFGDIIREEVHNRKLPKNEENVERVANWFHSGRERLLVHRLERKLSAIRATKPFIIEGARSPQQLKELKKKFTVRILAITLPQHIRWKRELARKRSDIRTRKDAKERDRREKSYGIEKLIAQANWRISSNNSIGEFRKSCRRFFKQKAVD